MDKKFIKDAFGWGFILWLAGYALGMIFFSVVPLWAIGWIIAPIGTALALWVLFKKVKGGSMRYYALLACVWVLIAVVFDYLFLVKAFNPPDGYYKLDAYLYYALTFVLPLAVGWRKNHEVKISNILKLIIAIGICELAGVVGFVFSVSAIPEWYAGLAKPALNPPDWIFGPVWAALYALMGISFYLVWKNNWEVKNRFLEGKRKAWNAWSERLWTGDLRKINAIAVFAAQYVLNAAWSYLFFGLKSSAFAFFEILALWFAIVWTIAVFYRISKPAAYLLLPYLLWVSFAGYLNYLIWTLNPSAGFGLKMPEIDKTAESVVADGGVVGKVLIGPLCPVMKIGNKNCEGGPYPTSIEIFSQNADESSKIIGTDGEGNFKIALKPGVYSLKPKGGNPFPACPKKEVSISSNQFQNIVFSCDTGIR